MKEKMRKISDRHKGVQKYMTDRTHSQAIPWENLQQTL